MWANEAIEATMDVVEKIAYSLRRANISWDIPLNSFSSQLNGKTRSMKMGSINVFTKKEKEDVTMIL
jgi:hypothetical protein